LCLCGKNYAVQITTAENRTASPVAIVEGLPAGLEINVRKINHELWRGSRATGAATAEDEKIR
jgi:chorismate synthase